jgi:sugar lactone lactonase YvrE
MTIDAEGKLWIALWDGGAVARFDPQTGEVLDTIALPVSRVTACTFGGTDLNTLFITSARIGLTPAQLASEPLAGAIFAVKTSVHGVAACEFRG